MSIADDPKLETLAELWKQPEEITLAAERIADAILLGNGIEVSIAPGNGTRYAFLVAPVEGLAPGYTSPLEYLESASAGKGACWFAWLNGPGRQIYPVALIGRAKPPALTYIAEKWCKDRYGEDALVIQKLFAAVGRLSV